MTDSGTLTLTGLLQDPLTRMLMRSDGVSEQDFSDLLLRVKDCLLARHGSAPLGQPAEEVLGS
ncbi:MAG: hypothetical protein P4L71_13370 [Acetobacteraceae bacterium]|nr:hypothetical protein [Acetobacteraceae bacterium]